MYDIDIQLMNNDQTSSFPRQAFSGHLKIEGTDCKDFITITPDDYIFKEYEIGNLEILVRLTKEEPKLIRTIFIYVKEEKDLSTLKKKYNIKKISGEKIDFKDFNFKLAIVDELMYNKELLKPKFDVYEYAALKNIKGFSVTEGGYEPLSEVVAYFEALEIDKNLALQVTEIYQNGNEIYGNLAPKWDGEDDLFNIQSFEDLKYFPNLKKMTLFETDPKIFEELKSKGIDAKPL